MKQHVESLLRRAGAAHGVYETTELNGVYDESWADWYADWVLANGMNNLLGTDFTPEQFSRILTEINEAHQQANTGESWAQFTARTLVSGYNGA